MKVSVLVVALATFFLGAPAFAAPLDAYSRLPAMQSVRISRDGLTVAYGTSRDQQQRVVIQRLDGEVISAIDLGDAKLRDIDWASDDYVVITMSTTTSIPRATLVGELFQAVSVDIRTGAVTQLMNLSRGSTMYYTVLAGNPSYGTWEGQPVMFVEGVTNDRRTGASFRLDLVRVDLDDGTTHLHEMGARTARNFAVTRDGEVLAQEFYDYDSAEWTLQARVNGSWRTVSRAEGPLDLPRVVGFTADGQSLLVSFWNEAEGVYRPTPLSLQTGEFAEPILPPNEYFLLRDPNQSMMGYGQNRVYYEYTLLDPARAAIWSQITAAFPDRQIDIESYTPDFTRVVIYVEGTGYPGNHILFDAQSGRFTQIGRARPSLTAEDIAEVRSITYHASDGREIQAYLTLPRDREPTNLPIVVFPHGGPQSRDVAGFDWIAQSLASRGYAVLQPNFRGSSGFGQEFVEAAYGEWGRKMQTDVSDGMAYLAQRGIVDPSRACIMGASYGGYAALAGVTVQSGLYRCAVAIAPVSDMENMLDWVIQRAGRESMSYRYWERYLGIEHPNDPRLDAVSPLLLAANGDAPVLLIHGRDDTVVPYSQSSSMERALRNAGRPVEFVTLAEEDHWLSREATRVQAMQAALIFIATHNPPSPRN